MFALLRALSLDEVFAPPPPQHPAPDPSQTKAEQQQQQQQPALVPATPAAPELAPTSPAHTFVAPGQSTRSNTAEVRALNGSDRSPRSHSRRPSSRSHVVGAKLREPIFQRGDHVVQTKASGLVRQGKIVSVHTDDVANGIYYTVIADDTGNEFQTDETLLARPGNNAESVTTNQEIETTPLSSQPLQEATTPALSPASASSSSQAPVPELAKAMKQPLDDHSVAAHVIRQNHTFVFDCDGVLWHGDEVIPGATEVLDHLSALGKRLVFVTNNSARHRSALREKLLRTGVPSTALDADGAVITAGWACARHISLRLPQVRRVFVVGMEGLHREFTEAGFDVVADQPVPGSAEAGGDEIFQDVLTRVGDGRGSGTEGRYQHIHAVVVGLDSTVDYRKLCVASVLIQTGSQFLCTNGDAFMMQGGKRRPGNGAIVASLQTTTGVQPTITGKPSVALSDVITALPGVQAETTCMVGDRLDTDMLFGRRAGWNCLAVLSGCSTPAMLELLGEDSPECPHFVARSVADLLGHLPPGRPQQTLDDRSSSEAHQATGDDPVDTHTPRSESDRESEPDAGDGSNGGGGAVARAALAIEHRVVADVQQDDSSLWDSRADGEGDGDDDIRS